MTDTKMTPAPSTIDQLKQRKSVRIFTKQPVDDQVRDQIIHCAFAAPTAGGQQLYTIIDVTDPAIKTELADCCDQQRFIANAPLVLVFLADCRRWLDAYQATGCDPRSLQLGDLYISFCDALIAAQNAVVAAHALGLGSCYIGDIIEQRERVSSLLSLDQYTVPATLVVFGYPTEQQLRRPKPLRFDERFIVMRDRYRRLSVDELRDAFASRGEDMDIRVPAFHQRKYAADFTDEMNRSMAEYLAPFGG